MAEDLQPVRIAAYVRVSKDKEAAARSFANQVNFYKDYAKHLPNAILVDVYADYACSGTTDKRPEFQRLLRDCRNGKVQRVVVKNVSRLGRDVIVVLKFVRELRGLGIPVYFEIERIDTLLSWNELFLAGLCAVAQFEAKVASDMVKWNIKRLFTRGIPTYSRLYGYVMENNHFKIIPEEAKVVKRIFQDCLDGYGSYRIAKRLNEDGIKPLYDDKWSPSTIKDMLKNEKYTGDLYLQKTFSNNYREKRKIYNRGEETRYLVTDAHQAIIPRSVFDQVQEKMAHTAKLNRSPHTSTKNADYIFTGHMFCGNCGSKFCHKLNHHHRKHYWSCNTYQTRGKSACSNGIIPEDILIEKTREVLGVTKLTPEIFETKLKRIVVPEHHKLQYHLKSGEIISATWQYRSRRESWTAEMRAQASKKSTNKS